jgi:translation initiation factor IF-3
VPACRACVGPGLPAELLGDTAIEKNLRCNEQIRISPIRLIDQNEQQIGIVEVQDALARAREAELDLVEVAPQARPPVCRILDYGKWKYAQQKKGQKAKSKRHEPELKEIRIKTPKIGDHDLEIKLNHAREFLQRGDRVQFTLRFRGRELAHIDEGQRVFARIREKLADIAKTDRDFRREGRRITMVLAPTGKKPAEPAAQPQKAEA